MNFSIVIFSVVIMVNAPIYPREIELLLLIHKFSEKLFLEMYF